MLSQAQPVHVENNALPIENLDEPLLLDFSPENHKKRKQYSIFDVFDDSDIEALTDRFQKQNQMEALERFKLKMDADTFAWALKDIKSTFL